MTRKTKVASLALDQHIGARIRTRRTLMGLSQEKMGEAIGVTFQQVQKYERGANRVSAAMLWELSRVLDVPLSFFMDGFDTATPPSDGIDRYRGSLEIARVYNQLPTNLQDFMLESGKALLRSTNDAATLRMVA